MKCKHPTLRVKNIQVAERCSGCWKYVTRDGRTYRSAQRAWERAQTINHPDQNEKGVRS